MPFVSLCEYLLHCFLLCDNNNTMILSNKSSRSCIYQGFNIYASEMLPPFLKLLCHNESSSLEDLQMSWHLSTCRSVSSLLLDVYVDASSIFGTQSICYSQTELLFKALGCVYVSSTATCKHQASALYFNPQNTLVLTSNVQCGRCIHIDSVKL